MHEVIVYHNPVSAWFWHMMMTGDGIGVIAALAVLAGLWIFLCVTMDKIKRANRRNGVGTFVDKYYWWIANVTTLVVAFGMHYYFTYLY